MALLLYITKAEYAGGLSVSLTFNDGTQRTVDFTSFFQSHFHPQYNKYREEKHFKRFYIENGNIVWGKNWDLMFPIEQLHAAELQ